MQSTIFDIYKICNMHNICWQQTFSFSMGKLCLISLIIMSLLTQTIIAITCYYVIINTNHHRHHLLLCDDKHKLSSSSSWSLASHIMVDMVTQHIPTSHIPIRWESVIMMKGGNMTQSFSYHTHDKYNDEGVWGVVRLDEWNPYVTPQTSSRHHPNNLQTPLNKPVCPI